MTPYFKGPYNFSSPRAYPGRALDRNFAGGFLPTEPGSSLFNLPKKFGRYEVVRELGKGAMGVVYLGRDPVIGRLVALKTIRVFVEDDVEEREFGERFLREAQAAGILSHPNIVTVHDVGEDEVSHTSFIAMEYVEGKNLKQLLHEKTPYPFQRIAEIIGQVAEALDYAHRRGIVHRDVKPANIIITGDGVVKITDFGIAKTEKSNLTSTGQFLGTPNYMSPEQVTGEAVDGRSDLFSLGVVLYELLTKKKPFSAENLTSISYKIVHETFTPPETYDASVPSEFSQILHRALAKDPATRFQRGNDFALALYEFKAREEERQILRDLGQMVAQAENLGAVAPVEAKTPSFPAVPPSVRSSAEHVAIASPLAVREGPPASKLEAAPEFELDEKAAAPRPVRDLIRDVEPPRAPAEPATALSTTGVPPMAAPTTKIAVNAVTPEMEASLPGSEIPAAVFEAAESAPRNMAETARSDGPFGIAAIVAELSKRVTDGRTERLPPPLITELTEIAEVSERAGKGLDSLPTEILAKPAAIGAPSTSGRPDPPRRPPEPLSADRATSEGAAGDSSWSPFLEPVAPPPPPAAPAALAALAAPAALAASPSPAPAASGRTALSHLKRSVSYKYAVLVIGGVILLAAGLVGALMMTRSSIEPSAPVDPALEREVAARHGLMEEGNRRLAAGKLEEALASYRELVRRAPDSIAARGAVQKTEALLAVRKETDAKSEELKGHLSAAREALGASDDVKVIAESAAALLLDPENAEAKTLSQDAKDRQEKAEQKRLAEAWAKKKKARPTPAPTVAVAALASPRAQEAPQAPGPTPGRANLKITFQCPLPQGYVMVRLNDKEVFRKAFDFGKKSAGGLVEGTVDIPSGPGEFKVWVIATDRTVTDYKTLQGVVPGGGLKTLKLELDGTKKLLIVLM